MKRHHVRRQCPDGADHIGEEFTLTSAQCHHVPGGNRGAIDQR
jgi:hypothetical protein